MGFMFCDLHVSLNPSLGGGGGGGGGYKFVLLTIKMC